MIAALRMEIVCVRSFLIVLDIGSQQGSMSIALIRVRDTFRRPKFGIAPWFESGESFHPAQISF